MGLFDFIGDAVSDVAGAAGDIFSAGAGAIGSILGSPIGTIGATILGGPAGFFLTPTGAAVGAKLGGALGLPSFNPYALGKAAPKPLKKPAPKLPLRPPPRLPARLAPRTALRPAAKKTVVISGRQAFAAPVARVAGGLAGLAQQARAGTAAPSTAQALVVQALQKGIAGQGLTAQEAAIFNAWKVQTPTGRAYVAQQQAKLRAKIGPGFVGPGHAPPQRIDPVLFDGGTGPRAIVPIGGSRSFVGPGGPPPRGDTIFDDGPIVVAPGGGGGAVLQGDIVGPGGHPRSSGHVSLDAFDGGSYDALPFEPGPAPRRAHLRNAAALHTGAWREKRRRQRRRRRMLPLNGGYLNTHPAIPVRRRN